MRNTCEKYSETKVPYKHRETIRNLSNNQNIVIMKQDKRSGVVIMNRNICFEKCFALLSSEQFVKLNQDPTAITERIAKGRVSKVLRNRKDL